MPLAPERRYIRPAPPRRTSGTAIARIMVVFNGRGGVSLYTIRAMASELRAQARNYRYVAMLRRHARAKYGRVITVRPSVLIGEALIAIDRLRWTRVTILLALMLLAARR
jgi:hypothetical protein